MCIRDSLRASHILLFGGLNDAMLMREGVASDCPFTVRSLLHVIAGHCDHHLEVMRARYL